MPSPSLDSAQAVLHWFQRSGVRAPLAACMGPLPQTGASIARWARAEPDPRIQAVQPHPDSYRIALMLKPLESQIWVGERPVWGGVIGAHRFRICPPGTPSRWRQLSGCDIVNLFIPVATVQALAEHGGLPAGPQLAATLFAPDRLVLDLVGKMLDAPALAGQLAPQYCDGLVNALLCYLLERYGKTASGSATPASLGGSRLRALLVFLEAELAREIPIAEMAQRCGMSESHFSRAFHAAMGLPPHQYLLKLRLERASTALREGTAPVTQIALDLGFSSPSHFARCFAARYGLPPVRYRREHGREHGLEHGREASRH
ncbi:MAG: AraC family transcriptional regulator [Inhella sp.]